MAATSGSSSRRTSRARFGCGRRVRRLVSSSRTSRVARSSLRPRGHLSRWDVGRHWIRRQRPNVSGGALAAAPAERRRRVRSWAGGGAQCAGLSGTVADLRSCRRFTPAAARGVGARRPADRGRDRRWLADGAPGARLVRVGRPVEPKRVARGSGYQDACRLPGSPRTGMVGAAISPTSSATCSASKCPSRAARGAFSCLATRTCVCSPRHSLPGSGRPSSPARALYD